MTTNAVTNDKVGIMTTHSFQGNLLLGNQRGGSVLKEPDRTKCVSYHRKLLNDIARNVISYNLILSQKILPVLIIAKMDIKFTAITFLFNTPLKQITNTTSNKKYTISFCYRYHMYTFNRHLEP